MAKKVAILLVVSLISSAMLFFRYSVRLPYRTDGLDIHRERKRCRNEYLSTGRSQRNSQMSVFSMDRSESGIQLST
jgi:hypothetical protein